MIDLFISFFSFICINMQKSDYRDYLKCQVWTSKIRIRALVVGVHQFPSCCRPPQNLRYLSRPMFKNSLLSVCNHTVVHPPFQRKPIKSHIPIKPLCQASNLSLITEQAGSQTLMQPVTPLCTCEKRLWSLIRHMSISKHEKVPLNCTTKCREEHMWSVCAARKCTL